PSEDFEKAAAAAKNLPKTLSNEDLLDLYGLFKQATVGDNTTAQPGMFDLTGKAKWSAWNKHKTTSKEAAEAAYIKLVADLANKHK
ncbi:hypothetical protein BGZ76_009153, partial [Entomortierella beljakovae]